MTKNSKFSLLAIIPLFVLCFIARFFQISNGTDFSTGFLYNENGFLVNFAFYGLLILTLGAVIALCVLDKKRGSAYFENDVRGTMVDMRAVAVGFPLLVAGAMAAYEGYLQLSALTPSAFLIFVDFLFGAAMVILGFVILYKKEITAAVGFSLVVPAIYYTLRGICVFIDRMVIASVPEYLIECLTIIGMGVFFMLLAKLLSGNESKHTRTAVSAVGATVSVMTLSSAITAVAADLIYSHDIGTRIVTNANDAELYRQALISQTALMNVSDHGYHMAYTSWVDVVMAVLIILTLSSLYAKAKPVQAEEENKLPEIQQFPDDEDIETEE